MSPLIILCNMAAAAASFSAATCCSNFSWVEEQSLFRLPRGPFEVDKRFPNLIYQFSESRNLFDEMAQKADQWDLCVLVGSQVPYRVPSRYSGYKFMLHWNTSKSRTLRIAEDVEKGKRVVLVAHPLSNQPFSALNRLIMLLKCFLLPNFHRRMDYQPLDFMWNRFYSTFKRRYSYQVRIV